MNLLVTGGCGFIGSCFVHLQRRLYPTDRVVVLDALTYAGNSRNLWDLRDDPGLRLVRGDVRDGDLLRRLLAEEEVGAVAHLAAETHVDRSIDGPLAFAEANMLGTAVLLEEARRAGVGRFLHVSTDEVYGSLAPNDPAFTEDHPLDPRSPYSASKAASDHLAMAYFHTFGFPVVVTRCSNNYGPRQFPEKLIPRMILRALAGEVLPVYGDGQNVRDWIHVEDHCAGLDAALRRGEAGRAYNLGGRCEKTNLEVVRSILQFLGLPSARIAFVADRPGHDRRYAIDCARAERELGWSPQIEFGAGLEQTVEWYLDNVSWCREVQDGSYRSLDWGRP